MPLGTQHLRNDLQDGLVVINQEDFCGWLLPLALSGESARLPVCGDLRPPWMNSFAGLFGDPERPQPWSRTGRRSSGARTNPPGLGRQE